MEQVERFRSSEENGKVMNRGGEPADGTLLLAGMTKAALPTESFIRSVVPGDQAGSDRGGNRRRVDYLSGLKENVIVGRMIPAGTGLSQYREMYIEKEEPASPRSSRICCAPRTWRTKTTA